MSGQRWQQLTYWPLIIVSWLFIVVYSWQVIADLQGTAHLVARVVMAATWLMFAVDYGVQFALSKRKRHWFTRHLFDLLVVILPALRPLRMLKALTVIHRLQRTTGTALRSGIAVYGAGSAIVLIWIASLAVLEAERDAPGATIVSFGDAVWWAFVTIATVGYGGLCPGHRDRTSGGGNADVLGACRGGCDYRDTFVVGDRAGRNRYQGRCQRQRQPRRQRPRPCPRWRIGDCRAGDCRARDRCRAEPEHSSRELRLARTPG